MLLFAMMDEPNAKRRFASSSAEERQKIVADAVPKKTKLQWSSGLVFSWNIVFSVDKGDVNL